MSTQNTWYTIDRKDGKFMIRKFSVDPHYYCEQFYCPDCRASWCYDDGIEYRHSGEATVACPECDRMMTNTGHLEACDVENEQLKGWISNERYA